MPITAKLSKKFYERLGDDVANELTEWLNLVDTSYRQEFRELFEANFGRVEAELRAMGTRIADLEAHAERRMTDLEARLTSRMDAKLESLKSELLKWMFLFWVGTMGTVVAILKL
jgi:hypothetical protein